MSNGRLRWHGNCEVFSWVSGNALMAEPMGPGTRARYAHALSLYEVTGYVDFNERSQKWIRSKLKCDPRLVAAAMDSYVQGGGVIKAVREQGDPSVYQNEFHYDLWPPF